MATITTGNHPKALWPGVHTFWGIEYERHPLECLEIFDELSSGQNYEEDVEALSFGLAPEKPQGAATSYDSHTQGPTTRYTHVSYSSGYIVTREEMDDNLYPKLSRSRTSSLALSMYTTKETVAANVLNRGFNSSFVGGDGVELFSVIHITSDGTQSNHLTVAADFSEAALEDMLIQINSSTNSKGLKIALRAKKMIIPVDLEFNVQRVLASVLQSGTANNDINAVRALQMMPEGYRINHYLTDSDAWFVKTTAPDGMRLYTRTPIEFTADNDFDTGNAKAKAFERYSFGWTNWLSMFASPGV